MSSYIPIVISCNDVVADNLDGTNDGENYLSTPFMTVGSSIYHDVILFIYRLYLAYLYERHSERLTLEPTGQPVVPHNELVSTEGVAYQMDGTNVVDNHPISPGMRLCGESTHNFILFM
jgi:hypothetical protein